MTVPSQNPLAWRAIVIAPILLVGIVMLQVRIDAQQKNLAKQNE
jgi:hypothetical protein